MVLAACLHEDQSRKGTSRPYVGHLLGVASLVLQYGGAEDEAIAALLHDAIEDQGDRITLVAIREQFGETVARIVEACTDSFTTPKPPWEERKRDYLAHVRTSAADERLVSAADKLYNVREIVMDYRRKGDEAFARFNAPKERVLWYYRELAREFLATNTGPVAEELARTVAELEKLAGRI
jgi:(p)ppGpp synthase/HD superfamily hydrolase